MEEGTIFIYAIFAIAYLILTIVLIIKFFQIASDLKSVKDLLTKQYWENKENKKATVKSDNIVIEKQDKEQVDLLKKKLLPNQCIIKILENSIIEVWNKETWNEKVLEGKSQYFKLLYKNY